MKYVAYLKPLVVQISHIDIVILIHGHGVRPVEVTLLFAIFPEDQVPFARLRYDPDPVVSRVCHHDRVL